MQIIPNYVNYQVSIDAGLSSEISSSEIHSFLLRIIGNQMYVHIHYNYQQIIKKRKSELLALGQQIILV